MWQAVRAMPKMSIFLRSNHYSLINDDDIAVVPQPK